MRKNLVQVSAASANIGGRLSLLMEMLIGGILDKSSYEIIENYGKIIYKLR